MSSENVEPRPLSAFAAARARRIQQISKQTPASIGTPGPDLNDRDSTTNEINEKHSRLTTKLQSKDFRAQALDLVSSVDVESFAGADRRTASAYFTDDYSSDSGADDASDDAKPTFWEFSSWRSLRDNVLPSAEDSLSLQLKPNETLAVAGMYQLSVQNGAISIFGASLYAGQSHPVCAPSIGSIPVIRGLPPTGGGIDLSTRLNGMLDLHRISGSFDNIWSIEKYGGNLDPKLLNRTYSVIHDSESDPTRRFMSPLMLPSSWEDYLRNFESRGKNQSILVLGPSGSGKSTICSLISNRFVSKRDSTVPNTIFMLDLDHRSPCYTLPGTVALVQIKNVLLGSSLETASSEHSEDFKIIRRYTIPFESLSEYPSYYFAAVSNLHYLFKEKYREKSSCHLVVDTPCLSTASELTAFLEMIEWKGISDLIYLNQEVSSAVDSALLEAKERWSARLTMLSQQPTVKLNRADLNAPDMRLAAHFHHEKDVLNNVDWNYVPLSYVPPIVVSFAGPMVGLAGVLMFDEAVDPTFYPKILEGSLVYIAKLLNARLLKELRSTSKRDPNDIPALAFRDRMNEPYLEPDFIEIHCLGLVREVDLKARAFHIILPPQQEHLLLEIDSQETVFVHGCLETPEWAFLEDYYFDEYLSSTQLHAPPTKKRRTKDYHEACAIKTKDSTPPWTMRSRELQQWGGINASRRLRKFNG